MFAGIIVNLVIIIFVAYLTIVNIAMGYSFNSYKDECLKEDSGCYTMSAAGFLRLKNKKATILGANEESSVGPWRIEQKEDPQIEAKGVLVADSNFKKILYFNNNEEIMPIASITKLMTALVFLENNPGWEQEIMMTKADEKIGGIINVGRGEVVTVKDLFYITLIASDNNTAMALARSTGLTEVEFIKAMNKKAQVLGLFKTYFTDPTGLHRTNVSTAGEIIRLALEAFEKEEIQEASSATYTFTTLLKNKVRTVKNTNHLVRGIYRNFDYEFLGSKTGYIEESGYNLVMQVENEEGNELIAVLLGCESNPERFSDMKTLINWVYDSYKWQ